MFQSDFFLNRIEQTGLDIDNSLANTGSYQQAVTTLSPTGERRCNTGGCQVDANDEPVRVVVLIQFVRFFNKLI